MDNYICLFYKSQYKTFPFLDFLRLGSGSNKNILPEIKELFFGGSEEPREDAGLLEGAVLLERRKEMRL